MIGILLIPEKENVIAIVLAIKRVRKGPCSAGKLFVQQSSDASIDRQQMPRTVLRETDVDRVKERKDDKQAEAEQSREKVTVSVGRLTAVNQKTDCCGDHQQQREPRVARLVQEEAEVKRWKGNQREEDS